MSHLIRGWVAFTFLGVASCGTHDPSKSTISAVTAEDTYKAIGDKWAQTRDATGRDADVTRQYLSDQFLLLSHPAY